jgi:prolipoprotein diacylglyceryltransferase
MLSTILSLGPITISSLGFLTALGFFFGSFLIWKRGKEEGYDEEKLMDGIILSGLGALIGSRIWYAVLHYQELGLDLNSFFNIVGSPGFSWLGAFLGGILSLKLFAAKKKWEFFKIVDIFTFGISLTACFMAVGYFLDGSMYGASTNLPWGIVFPGLETARHPTQLYELFLLIVIFRLLYFFDKNYRTYEWYKGRRGEAAPGFLTLAFLGLFSLEKFAVGFFYEHDLYWNVNQLAALFLSFLSLLGLYLKSGKAADLSLAGWFKKNGQQKIKNRKKTKKLHFKTGIDAK